MSITHEVIRIIKGVRYRCRDIGCDDFDNARRSRLKVAEGLFTTEYKRIERKLKTTPLNKPLPPDIPLGNLPMVDKKAWGQYCGEGGSDMHEEE